MTQIIVPEYEVETKEIYLNVKPQTIQSIPALKWAGGKRLLLKEILKVVPDKFNRYYEVFFGGGALYFALNPCPAVISDCNEKLINTYIQIRDNCDKIIEGLKLAVNTQEEYLEVRSWKPDNKIHEAIRFIYLNKTCWNGLYRENSRGEFNVPFAHYKNPVICDEELLLQTSNILKRAEIRVADFEESVKGARKGDFVYFDPPYTVMHDNNGFIKYNAKIFSWDDQVRLAKLARKLTNKGVFVLISNAHHDEIKKLYSSFNSIEIRRSSTISGEKKGRRPVTEYLFYNY